MALKMNEHEKMLVERLKQVGKEQRIAELAEVIFAKTPWARAASWVRNALRRPRVHGLVRLVGRGTYTATPKAYKLDTNTGTRVYPSAQAARTPRVHPPAVPLVSRMKALLTEQGPMTSAELVEKLNAPAPSVRRARADIAALLKEVDKGGHRAWGIA